MEKEHLYFNNNVDSKTINLYELSIIKNILSENKVDFQYKIVNESLFTNFMKYWNEDSVLQMDSLIQNLTTEFLELFKKYFGNDIPRIHNTANIVKDFHYLNKNTKKFKTSAVIHMGFRGNNIQPWFTPFDFPYFKLINQLNNKCKETILKYYPYAIQYTKEPSKKLLKIALLHCDKKNEKAKDVFKDITLPEDLQIFGIQNDKFENINDIKDITPNARLLFIYMHPELIDLKIEELNDKELKIYNKRMEEYNINLVKKDYKNIEKISNPSTTVRNIAISEFRKKWER